MACVALFYSEDTEEVYHVFATDNLKHSLSTKSHFQTAALRKDPMVRVAWIPSESASDRDRLMRSLRERFQLNQPASGISHV